ncbi:MAG: hypothetical protein COB75_07605 [Idiomarina sp.]|nr:hypothetical protein [Idiomarina sp.]PHQ74277.1 MAG: hypothetical protein COB75_07605 [Idiomarina sp.]
MKTDNKLLSTIYLALVLIGGYLVGGTIVKSFQASELTLHSTEFKDFLIALLISSLYHWWKVRKEKATNEHF